MNLFQKIEPATKFGRVAICLSGLIRTGIEAYPGFKFFFQNLNADVFFHTWDTEQDKLDKIIDLYNPKSYLITLPKKFERFENFGSMLYSIMMANEIKKEYEIEHNFRYDLVIKTRFDLVYYPGNCFPDHTIIPRTIYCSSGNVGVNNIDFELHGINDIIFWGDSAAMDIATNTFFAYKHKWMKSQLELIKGKQHDPKFSYLSAGNLIYNHFIKNNIAAHRFVPYICEIPWREDVKHLDHFKDYDLIKKRYEQF
jgi:hypothetical protein